MNETAGGIPVPNPWDIKLISELTEREMMDYAQFLELTDAVHRALELDSAVGYIFDQWLQQREEKADPRVEWNFTTGGYTHGWVSELGTVPTPGNANVDRLVVLVPRCLDEDTAKYVIREQLMEQWVEVR